MRPASTWEQCDYPLTESGLRLDDGEETGSFALVLNSVNDRLETQDVSQAAKVDSEVYCNWANILCWLSVE